MNKIDVLKIASDIFANGRIDNPEDWDEMEVQLDFVLCDEYGIESNSPQYKAAMGMVRGRWYPAD